MDGDTVTDLGTLGGDEGRIQAVEEVPWGAGYSVPDGADVLIGTDPWCTLTQAWEYRADEWTMLREFRSSIGPNGWGKHEQGDGGTPEGVYAITITFSTGDAPPGPMPWRQRLPTSTVTNQEGPLYNTWIEEEGRTDGDRPSMRWGFVVDFNHVRLEPGVGPAPLPEAGSGIFYHTSRPGRRWEPSEGCTRVGDPAQMRWLLTWLDPDSHPRVVHNR
jgi:L,D-peptidoglycan transpeptidase YkuD (ErfK/YbiS/YcfS/YnhG family)